MTFNKKFILRTVSTILLAEAVAMIPSMLMAIYDRDMIVTRGFIITIVISALIGTVGVVATKNHHVKIKTRESYFVVLVCWLTVIIAGTLPYLLGAPGCSPADAIFESVASWTTSSAWVLDINYVPRAITLWRATASWLGGMWVILLAVLVLSAMGVSAQKLANAELPGPTLVKTSARMLDMVKEIYLIYGIMTVVELILLYLGKVPLYDAIINSMTSVSTAGMLDYQNGLSAHATSYIKGVVGVFAILSSMNFALLVGIYKGRIKKVVEDYELGCYIIIIGVSALFIGLILRFTGVRHDIFGAIIDAFAGVVSYASTSGFPLERVDHWPSICKAILLILMIIGGCSGSTSGGIKVIRFAVFIKIIQRGIYKRIHPHASRPILLRKKTMSSESVSSIATFLLLFFATYLAATLVLSLENLDMETTLSAPIALFTNTGLGFGLVSKADYRVFSQAGRLACSFIMMMGRLEMYAILILFSRSFWNSDRAK